ncbi:nuclear transport factor 2 family protein [Spirosoma koreense]
MKILVFFIACLCATTSFAQQAAEPAQNPTSLGNAFFKSLLDEDSNTMSKLLASDFTMTNYDGHSVGGDMLVQGISGGYVVVDASTVSNTETRQYNADAAVMTGNLKTKGQVQGQAFDATVTFSVVCAKQSGSWKIVNVQLTPVQ